MVRKDVSPLEGTKKKFVPFSDHHLTTEHLNTVQVKVCYSDVYVIQISIPDESDIRIPTANWKFYFFRFQVFLGGEDQRHLDYKSRLENCRVFARAINKPSLPDYAVVRAKEMFGLESIGQIINGLQPRVLKGAGMRDRLTWDVELHAADPASTRYFCPAGKLRGIYATCKILFNMSHSKI